MSEDQGPSYTDSYYQELRQFELCVQTLAEAFESGGLENTEAQGGQLHFRVGPYRVRTQVVEVVHDPLVKAPPPRSTSLGLVRERQLLRGDLRNLVSALGTRLPANLDLNTLSERSIKGLRTIARMALTEMAELRQRVDERPASR